MGPSPSAAGSGHNAAEWVISIRTKSSGCKVLRDRALKARANHSGNRKEVFSEEAAEVEDERHTVQALTRAVRAMVIARAV